MQMSAVIADVRSGQVRYGSYAGAMRRRVHLVTVLLRPSSGCRQGRRQARRARIPQTGIHLTQPRSVDVPSAWSSHSDTYKEESGGREPQEIEPHAHRGVIVALELFRRLVSGQPP